MTKSTSPIYEAQVGPLGSVTFFKDPESDTYCFMFFNGVDYTPLTLSEDAAYYVWAFIGCEHPDANGTISTFTPPKKAGKSKPKKQPSKPTKKKAKSK
jgi:hypothetical protein